MDKKRSVSNKNRIKKALQILSRTYGEGHVPIVADVPPEQHPYTYREEYVHQMADVKRVSSAVVDIVLKGLENRIRSRIECVRELGDHGGVLLGKAHWRMAANANIFLELGEGYTSVLEIRDFMIQDAVKVIKMQMGITRMCREINDAITRDALAWFVYAHHIACCSARSQGRGMLQPEHFQYACACFGA